MLSAKQSLFRFFIVGLFLCLTSTVFGQATVSIEVNWPSWASDNRVTLRDPSNALIGQICDPANCYNSAANSNYAATINYNVPYANGYTILLEDNWGDAWNGTNPYVRVYVDGVLTLENDGQHINVNGVNGNYVDVLPRTLAFDVTTNPTAFNEDLSVFDEFPGYSDYSTAGNTLRTQPNSPSGNACAITTSSSGTLTKTIPGTGTIERAYLYWASSGINIDANVALDGQPVTADHTFRSYSKFNQGYFTGGVADVTTIVQASATGTYTFSGLTIDNSLQYCSVETVLGGWSVIVFYSDPALPASSVVLYSGFKGDSGTNYAGGVATSTFSLSGFYAIGSAGSKTSALSWEGDQTLANNESLTFTTVSSGTNKLVGDGDNNGTTRDNPFNSTIFDSSALPVVNNTAAYGMDLDTYDVSAYINAGESSATTTVNVGQDFVIMNAVVLKVPSNLITGYVFEDVNYGGGAGRSLATSGGSPLVGVTVELYDNGGTLMQTTTTDANGYYLFGGMINGTHQVRVVNATVASTRSGGSGCGTCFPVQTFKTNYAASALIPVTNEVGGANPAAQDVAAGTITGAQSVASVTINNEGAIGVDFGFNFNTIVNTNDSGQGSIRQFIVNSNALGGEASLAQAGLTAARETSIFEIPGAGPHMITLASSLPIVTGPSTWLDGITQSGASCGPHDLRIILNGADVATNGIRPRNIGQGIRGFSMRNFQSYAINIQVEAIGAQILCNYVGLDPDGITVTPNSTNTASAIRVLAVGVEIGDGTNAGLNIISGNHHDGISITNFTGNLASPIRIRGNYIGVAADGLTPLPNGTIGAATYNGAGIEIGNVASSYVEIGGTGIGDGNVISGNLEHGIVVENNSSHVSILGNLIGLGADGSTQVGNTEQGIHLNASDAITVGDGSSAGRNVIANNGDHGIYLTNATGVGVLGNYIGVTSDGTTAAGNTRHGIYLNNTSDATIGTTTSGDENSIAYNGAHGVLISRTSTGQITSNQIYNNIGDGITVIDDAIGVTISQNQTYNNGGLGIDLGNDNVTLNDTGDGDTGPNGLMNFPIISAAYLSGSNLVVKGWARPGSQIEMFLTDVNEGTAAEGDNQFGMSTDYGEGQTYFVTVLEGGGADTDGSTSSYTDVDGNTDNTNRFQFSVPAPVGLALGDYITATATISGSTSEFSPRSIITVGTIITNRRITYRINQ